MLQVSTTVILLATAFAVRINNESSQNDFAVGSESNPHTTQEHELSNSLLLDDDMTEKHKRSWKDLPTSGWGKRSWKDFSGSGWGKRNWQDLQTSSWGKRGWQDLLASGWGKRGWKNLQSSGWGKRSWKNLASSGWGKRSRNDLQNFWGKSEHGDKMENSEKYLYLEHLEDSLDKAKRGWNNLRATWGKRGASDWASMKGAWGKRDPAWHNLKGLWGKRSRDNYSDNTRQDLQDLIVFQKKYDSEKKSEQI